MKYTLMRMKAANNYKTHSSSTRLELFQFKRRHFSAILLAFLLLLCATARSWAATAYVNINNHAPSAPYASWATAATNIQNAVDAAAPGDLVLVTDGVYQTGGRIVDGALSNRVVVTKPLTLLSVNGPGVTMIFGQQVPSYLYGAPNGNGAMRCVYLTNGAVLSGFTLMNGATLSASFDARLSSGGGAWCASSNVVVTNCVLLNNACSYSGGGAYSGILNNCTLSGNSVIGGDYYVKGGGGAYSSILNNCTLRGNSAYYGGGASSGTLNNCVLIGNSAPGGNGGGGGAYNATLNNCTLSGNSARTFGGGAQSGKLNNCVLSGNSATIGLNWYSSTLNYCCATPLFIGGKGNFTNAPLFVDQAGGDFHLQASSPCINAGLNAYVQGNSDLDGNARIRGGTVDVGAYEFQLPTSLLSYAWLQRYSLPIDGSADFADTDLDGMSNWQEWVAGTDPTDGAPLLKVMQAASTVGLVTLTWTSVTNHSYFVERATDLGAVKPFSLLQGNVAGLQGTTSFTDTNAPAPAYYRVGVQ